MATPRKGGIASVLVKSKETGRLAGHADLKGVRPSAVKVLGPVAWQALAMATQQHFLVEINDKLAGIGAGVDKLLARDTDSKLAELHELREEVERAHGSLAGGHPPTEPELRQWLHRAGILRKELGRQAERAAREYLTGERSAQDADEAFTLAVVAVQVLSELSSLYGALPVQSIEELQHRLNVERARVEPAREALRGVADTMDVAHHRWRMQQALYERARPKTRVVRGINRVSPKALGAPEPRGRPLSAEGAERTATVLGLAPRQAESLLVELGAGGDVRVAVESVTPQPANAAELTEDDIERAVTLYDGHWWALGQYGPYDTKDAAVSRLRTLPPPLTSRKCEVDG
jgi:hypothetical protein